VNRSRVETIEGMRRILARSANASCIDIRFGLGATSMVWSIYELGKLVDYGHRSNKAAQEARRRRAADLGARIWSDTCGAHGVSELHGWHYCTEYFDEEDRRWIGGWYSGTTFLGVSAPCIVAAWAMRGGAK
jgi:hypothetical protein